VIVWHALWTAGDRLAVWAEGAVPASPPFAGTPTTIKLLLPTSGGRRRPSPELFEPSPSGEVVLAPWAVECFTYDPDEAYALLTDLPDQGLVLGASLRHLVAVTAFAREVSARGRVVPTIAGSRAVWRPVLTGEDRRWAQLLVQALPPSAYADASSVDQMRAPEAVLAAALDALVDAAVRVKIGRAGRAKRPKDAAAAWRAALSGADRAIEATPPDVQRLSREVANWQRDAAAGPIRALFRLVEPTRPAIDVSEAAAVVDVVSDESWRVELALQSADEPSLVVAADQIWRARSGSIKALRRHLDAPQETFLAELGRAARLWPDLDKALGEAKPAVLELDAAGAHAFLREAAPLLAGAGFGVLLPSWWGRPTARLGAKLTAKSPTAPGTVANSTSLGFDALVDYEWELALGDHTLTQAELRRLAKVKAPLVRVRGQWVELDPKHLAAGLALMADKGQMTVLELLQGAAAANADLPVVEVQATGWIGDLLASERIDAASISPDFTGTLRPYQHRGVSWLTFLERLGLGAVLADDMGLGKTAQMLALVLNRTPDQGPTLLVCPMSLVGNWQREAAKFAPALRVHVHHGAERAQGKGFAQAVADADLVVTTYALAARDAAALRKIEWHRIVVDEAQAIKNAATRQAVAVRSLPARHKVAVTGTPVENRLADLWAIMEFVNPGLLGPAAEFKRAYAEPIQRHGDERAAERLRRLTGPFVLRRLKTDKSIITDLPEKLEMEVVCNLTAEQATLYQAVVDEALAAIEGSDGIERKGLVLATMTKLKQVCNHPAQLLRDGSRLDGRSGKLARLEAIVEEILAAGEKTLLFTQYAEFGGALQSYLTARFGREVLYLHGGVMKKERDAMVERFQGSGGPSLFVLSLKAGGTGLTLTAANHVIHVDRWWNPAVEDQATDRAFRIGQRRAVQVRKFVCAGTIEEKISAMIADKRDLAARIVGTGEGWITELSTAQLRDLFALEHTAVVE
jgi:SNF2-related domain/SNF2 Helicase protein/Helicase conserved C-terminal domain